LNLNDRYRSQENISGYYRIFTYFIAKLVCDILPMRVVPSILFSLISYFMTGLQRTASQFFVFLVTVFMASVFGSSVGFFMAATISSFGKGMCLGFY
jgi:ATP-binding cassette, subfamily G (WHITE), member 2